MTLAGVLHHTPGVLHHTRVHQHVPIGCGTPPLYKVSDFRGMGSFSHSHASHAIAGGMPIEIAQQDLGHASLATTTIYVTTEKRRRMKAVEAFWRK